MHALEVSVVADGSSMRKLVVWLVATLEKWTKP